MTWGRKIAAAFVLILGVHVLANTTENPVNSDVSQQTETHVDVKEDHLQGDVDLKGSPSLENNAEEQKVEMHSQDDAQPSPQEPEKPQRPNIVVFMADDLGYGDVGCFGNDTIKTPNIDSICKRGVKLSQHLAADAMCTPSRAAFLTGRMPVRTGLATESIIGALPIVGSAAGLPNSEKTFPSMLRSAGYNTALIGKWHLGMDCEKFGDHCHHPHTHGFDYWFGLPLTVFRNMGDDSNVFLEAFPNPVMISYVSAVVLFVSIVIVWRYLGKCPGITMLILTAVILGSVITAWSTIHIWNAMLMRNGEVVEQPVNLEDRMAQRLVNEGIRFLEKQETGKPFLLYMAWFQVHTALHASERFRGHSAHGRYGDEVEEMDWSTGEILSALEKFGFLDNTIVYFTSDNGGHIEETHGIYGYRTGGHNGVLRGGKSQGGQEGGIRMPSAMMWPGKLPAGTDVSVPTSLMDIYPTLLSMVGIEPPTDRILDGVDITSLLTGHTQEPPHKFMFHNCGVWLHAVRYTPGDGSDVYKVYYYWPKWKYGDGCDLICQCLSGHYKLDVPTITNIGQDPSELHHLQPSSELYKEILQTVEGARSQYAKTLEPVTNEFEKGFVWKPALQPCCTLPTCQCSGDYDNALNYIPPWDKK